MQRSKAQKDMAVTYRSLRAAGVCATALLAVILAPLPAAAQFPTVGALPNLNGIWERKRGEGSLYLPILPRGSNGEEHPPYNDEWEKKYEAIRVRNRTGVDTYDPTIQCLPSGMPRMMGMQYPMEILMTPNQVTMIIEFFNQIRRVFTDGRAHPPADELEATFRGHSIGHWEGDTLVIDTVGIRPETVLSRNGVIHSDELHVTERLRMVSHDELELQITSEDKVAFTRPWTVVRHYVRSSPTTEIREYVCAENLRQEPGPASRGKAPEPLPESAKLPEAK